jgi:hypothetical protein
MSIMEHEPWLWVWLLAAPVVLGIIDLVTTRGAQTSARPR